MYNKVLREDRDLNYGSHHCGADIKNMTEWWCIQRERVEKKKTELQTLPA